MNWLHVVLLGILFSHQILLLEAFSFNVDATREECFTETVEHVGIPIGVMFQVTQGGFLDIDVRIQGPDGKIILNEERQVEGKYNFISHATGDYSFCFGNRMSTLTPKKVSFVVNIGAEEPVQQNQPNLLKQENLAPVEMSVLQVGQGIQAIVDEQAYMKMREQAHRNTNESTNARVIWWSLFEVLVLIAMSLWQIYYLRRFFEVKRVGV